MMSDPELQIAPLSPVIGCEISGFDLSQPLSAKAVKSVRKALLDYGVIFFRDQDLSPRQQLDFCQAFGEPGEYPFVDGLPGYPHVNPIVKMAHETINFGGLWHSDTAYLSRPPMATVLHARTLPPIGGDTLFSCMYTAYEALSDGMKDMLSGLKAINCAHNAAVSETRTHRIEESAKDVSNKNFEAAHPVVRTHPETGKKALYVNVAHTARFEGMSEPESAGLLDYLFAHQVREEFTCRFRWSEGAVAFWDNRCTQHFPLNDYTGYERVLHRVTLKGDVPA